ncbi:hypothetical protein EN873_24955 [bacterium M00.F.Ca.ET.230.01.1.1]|nr:hypothetical protein EN873_24955 [bacterium M00.F.Ca.ET.230.01.1.1]
METAGNVVIQISANASAFEQALAKAKQSAEAFDATISAKLNGAGVSAGLTKIAGLVEQTNVLLTKMVGAANPAAASLQKMDTAAKDAASSTNLLNQALDDVQTSARPVAAAIGEVNAASRLNVALETQRSTVLGESKQALSGQTGAMRTAATEAGHLGSATRLGSAQMMALSHSARSAFETLALGVSPTQALLQQVNHLSFAMSGPEGLIAASAGVSEAFGAWLTTLPGILSTAGVAAVAAVGGYMLATRENIKSVDEVLKNHRALIDSISAGWPEAAAAAKKYEDQAKQLPRSVIAADTNDQLTDAQKTLSAMMDNMRRQMALLNTGGGDFSRIGQTGIAAFSHLADEIKSGTLDAVGLQNELGKLRLDPALSKNAHDFARALQETANKAVEVQQSIPATRVAQSIADGGKAVKTLFDISSGFSDIGKSADASSAEVAKLFGTFSQADSGGFGVAKSLQSTLTGFQQMDQAVQESRRNQLSSFLALDTQLRSTNQEIEAIKQAMANAGGKDSIKDFFPDTTGIKDVNSEIQRATDTVSKLFDALNAGGASTRTVFEGLDMVRQTLVRDGLGVDAVNKFMESLIQTRMRLDQDTASARQLNAAIQAIQNRTVTITLVTRQIGTGTQTQYSVPSSYTGGEAAGTGSSYGISGSSNVNVNRYGGDGSAGFTQQAYSVPSESGGSSTVGVTRFGGTRAAGGPVTANMPYWVGEHGPELVVPSAAGSVIPNAQSTMFAQALASAQSGFTGMQPTQDADRMWTVQMNIEANTRKTVQLLDDIKTATAASSSAFSGSSSSSGLTSSGVDQSAWDQAFNAAFKSAQANYQAARNAGGGDGIVPFAQGLVATPYQIALNAARLATGQGGAKSVGFATGGIDSSDTQHVEFFKNPNEKVIIARPDQFNDVRSADNSTAASSNKDRPLIGTLHMLIYLQGNAQPSKDSVAELRRQATLAVRDAIRGINGR